MIAPLIKLHWLNDSWPFPHLCEPTDGLSIMLLINTCKGEIITWQRLPDLYKSIFLNVTALTCSISAGDGRSSSETQLPLCTKKKKQRKKKMKINYCNITHLYHRLGNSPIWLVRSCASVSFTSSWTETGTTEAILSHLAFNKCIYEDFYSR